MSRFDRVRHFLLPFHSNNRFIMWPTTCGHIMKRCGCLSVCLSVTCHISKTEPDRAIVTMDHYIEVGCNPPIGTPWGAAPPQRGKSYYCKSNSCGGPHIVSILMIDTTCLVSFRTHIGRKSRNLYNPPPRIQHPRGGHSTPPWGDPV